MNKLKGRPQSPAERAHALRALGIAREVQVSRTMARFEELEHLTAGGVGLNDALTRVGWNWQSADRCARRHGRDDIRALLRRKR